MESRLARRSGGATAISFPAATVQQPVSSRVYPPSVGTPNPLVHGMALYNLILEAMHIAMSFALNDSVSTQAAALRRLLFSDNSKSTILHR